MFNVDCTLKCNKKALTISDQKPINLNKKSFFFVFSVAIRRKDVPEKSTFPSSSSPVKSGAVRKIIELLLRTFNRARSENIELPLQHFLACIISVHRVLLQFVSAIKLWNWAEHKIHHHDLVGARRWVSRWMCSSNKMLFFSISLSKLFCIHFLLKIAFCCSSDLLILIPTFLTLKCFFSSIIHARCCCCCNTSSSVEWYAKERL